MDRCEFAKILRNGRIRKKLTQTELAERGGLTLRAVQYWEQGQKNISLENADKLLKALGVEIKIGGSE
ncbi:MAG: helix-turn-helix domain-containing protein [Lachnospiraceae bacterium]|nr:helix-turn-helix domain-containing protein [Lachnospiraceae bacterium]